jgi:hypothetical protein
MDVLLSERQLKKLFEQDATADPAAQAPTAGTSPKQTGGQGYPEVGKWESGVTRGPANQVGITKWADVVGSKLNRGKANQLKETHYTKKEFELLIEQTMPFYDKTGKFFMGGPMNKPQGAIDANDLFPNIKDGKYPTTVDPKIIQSYLSYNGFSQFNPDNKNRLAVGNIFRSNNPQISPELSKYFAKSSPNYWKGKPQPQKPTPFNGQILSSTGTKLPEQPWGYYEGRLGNLETQMSQFESDLINWAKVNSPNDYYNMVRKSPKGLDVPKGYSPLEYDEYKSKIDPIVKQIEAIKKKYTYKPSGWMDSGENGSDKMSVEDTKLLNQLRLERDKLNGEYYNIDYPSGITKEELDSYKKWKKSIDDYYTSQESKYCQYGNVFDDPSYYNQSKTTQEKLKIDQYENQYKCTNLKKEHKEKITLLNQAFGYQRDSRSRFDKFWDEWGIVTQIGVGLLLTLVAPELGIPLLTIRNMAMVDSAFNVVVAAYETSRGDYDKAAGSVLFAILPHLKILKCPSSISKSISEKMANATIKTSTDLSIFMKTMLNEEELKWFKTVLNTDKESLENATKEITKRFLEKQKSLGVEVGSKQINNLKSSWLEKGINKFKKQNPLTKIKPNLIVRPMGIKSFSFDILGLETGTNIVKSIMEKSKIKIDEETQKKLATFFDTLPNEVKENFNKMSSKQIESLVTGKDVKETLNEIIIEKSEGKEKFTQQDIDKFYQMYDKAMKN